MKQIIFFLEGESLTLSESIKFEIMLLKWLTYRFWDYDI